MLTKQNDPYELLITRRIIDILIGDNKDCGAVEIESEAVITAKMPYQRGTDLCDLSTNFGLPVRYSSNGGNLSRWLYMQNLLEHCVEEGSCSKLLAHLFSKEKMKPILLKFSLESMPLAYSKIVEKILAEINKTLFISNHKLIKLGDAFIVQRIDQEIEISTPHISQVNRAYINELSQRAFKKIEDGAFDNALTKSRTLLEETFCYLIEQKGETPVKSGNINQLHKQVKELYNMHMNKDTDQRINNLLSGIGKIVSSITEMRNNNSDAHGVGLKRINIEKHHATLFVNSAVILANFLLAVEEKSRT